MVDLDEFAMAKLAREMAMAIRNYKVIFDDFNISEEEYYEIAKNDFFKKAKEQFALEWNSALSAAERVKLISASYAEEILPVVTRRAMNKDEPLPGVLGTFKQLCQNAGIGNPNIPIANAAERFVITINMGADVEHYDKSIEVNANEIDVKPAKDPDAKLRAEIKTKMIRKKDDDNGKTDNQSA